MAFKNRIRLPFHVRRPQFLEEAERFRDSNGRTKTISVVIRKTYAGETDFWPERWHERFKIALAHDNVNIEGDKYLGEITQDGEYTIEWPEFLDYPVAKANFIVEVNPFDASNNNCRTCEELTQVIATNDRFYSPLNEGESYEINVANNDEICCSPTVFSIVNFNENIIENVQITGEGVVTFDTKDPLEVANSANLLTYRITCPNGGYDEASVFADINGSIAACLAPDNIQYTLEYMGEDQVLFTWNAVGDATDYYWELYSSINPGTPLQTGTTADDFVIISDLPTDIPATYTFYVRTNCDDDTQSVFSNGISFNKSAEGNGCGQYKFTYTGSPANYSVAKPISYIDCFSGGGEIKNTVIFQSLTDCLLESSPGIPLYWAAQDVTIEYLGDCEGEGNTVNNKITAHNFNGFTKGVAVRINNEVITSVNENTTVYVVSSRPITTVRLSQNFVFIPPNISYIIRKRSDFSVLAIGTFNYPKTITLSVNEAIEIILN